MLCQIPAGEGNTSQNLPDNDNITRLNSIAVASGINRKACCFFNTIAAFILTLFC
jgi:hypothetical protein